MSLHNFNSNTKSWKMYTNTLTSISGDDLLVAPSYGKNLILEVSANNDIFFKKGGVTKRFDNLVSDYLDMSFVREASFNSLTSQVKYILQEISGSSALNLITSGISNDLLIKSYAGQDIILEVSGNSEIIFKRGDISYNLDDLIGGGGGFSQSSDYATYNILDITGKIIFTDNSTNVQHYNDASLNNVDISGSLKVAGSISAPNIYTKSEIDVSFVSKKLFDASLNSIQLSNVYTKAEIDVSFVSKELFETSYNFLLSSVGTSNESGDGGYFQNNDYASYDILNIADTIIFTDNSTNVQQINDASLNNVDISGSLKVAGSISAPNIYTKSEIDASFTNVYTKNQVYNKTQIDASFSNVYTRGQIDVSFVSKKLFDASLSSIQVSNVYTKNEVDVSFVSKQLFETSYNVLLSAIGTGGGGGSGSGSGGGSGGGTTTTTSSIAKKFYNQDWNLLGTNITKVKDVSGTSPTIMSASLDGYTILVYWPYSSIFYPTGVGSQEQPRSSIAVYTFISNSWVQKGETILLPFTYVPSWRYAESGGANGDQTGLATDFNISGKFMSGDGNTIAIPISRAGYGENTGEYLNNIYTDVVYSFNGTAWIEFASVTTQNSNRVGSAYFTFENNVIKRFLIGVGGSLTNVIIHTLTNGSFVQDSAQISESEVNTSINVPGSLDFWSRRARAISADGKVVLFCKTNSMVLFKYNGTIWQQYGNVTLITLPTWSTTIGKLSNDGSVFLVGSCDSTVNGDTYAGRSKIYAYDSLSNTWIQRGQDIVYEEVQYIDEAQGIQFGSDTKLLSGDGLTVAFGGRNRPSVIYNNDGGSNYYSGYLQAYRYSSVNNYWSKIGREITGVTMERPGQYIASSYNGNVIHIDGQSFKETSTSVDTGRIRVYEIEVDPSFSSLSSGSSSNGYSKIEIDASFVSKQLFETSYNVLLSAIGTGGGSGSGSGTSSIVNNYYNDNWNKLGEDLIFTNNNTISPYSFTGSGDVKLSADGKTAFFSVSGSAPNLPNCGFIVIYKYNDISNNWIYNNIITGNANENINRFAISNDAKTIIYRSEDDNERIRIKKYSDTTNSWYQVGSTINGGRYPIISGNGKIVGISNHFGDVQFYTISGDTYSLYPPEIPIQDGVLYPQNINLSYDGNIFSTGYLQANTNEGEPEIAAEVGAVRVFEFSGNSWVLKTTKRLTPIEIYSGSNINSISSDGRILAVGGLGNAGTGPNSGFVVIYKFDSNANDYIQIGQKLFPEEPWNTTTNDGMTFGRSIKLSGDGNSIVIGANAAKYTPLNISARGACFVYKYNPTNNFWSQLGDTIWGLDSEQVGWHVNMSYDGTIIATGTGNASRFRFYGINNISLSSSSSGSSSSSLTSDVASLLASLTSRIAMLEATAIIRSFDTIVGPVNSFNIPIDLSNNESLQIDMSVKITGEGGYKMFLKYNTESSTANLWRYYNGRFVYGEYGDGFALWGEDMLSENNGLLVEGPNTNETIIIRIEVFRSYDRASPTQKFWYKASTLFHWSDLGLSRIDCQGETSELSLIPTALYFNIAPQAQSTTNSSNSFMNVSYSIIKDMRRTALGGPIL